MLARLKPDVAFNVTHGRPGEDGMLSAVLEILRIPYTHSGVLASALAMDKAMAKRVLASAGVPVPGGLKVHRLEAAKRHLIERPYVISRTPKAPPSACSSSEKTTSTRRRKLTRADWALDETVLVEPFIAGRELTCAVYMGRASAVCEILQGNAFYDYEAKYAEGGSRHVIPAPLKPNIYDEVRRLTLEAHHALGCKGVTVPTSGSTTRPVERARSSAWKSTRNRGMTGTSLVPDMPRTKGSPSANSWNGWCRTLVSIA